MRGYLCHLLSITQVSGGLFLFLLWNPPRKHHNEFWGAMECLAVGLLHLIWKISYPDRFFIFCSPSDKEHCTTSWKVTGSIPDGVIGIFHWQSFWSHYGPGVDSASNRNEHQEYFLEGKGGQCIGLTTLPPSCAERLEIWEPRPPGTLRACSGLYSGKYQDGIIQEHYIIWQLSWLIQTILHASRQCSSHCCFSVPWVRVGMLWSVWWSE